MKKALLSALILLSLLLTGCGGRAVRSRYEDFSASLQEKETLSYQAQLVASYPDRNLEFTLRYEKSPAGEQITVLAPALIEGISARLEPGSRSLCYEGMILDAGPLDPYGLTPMSALPRLTEALMQGHLDSHWEEDGHTVLRLIPDDHLTATVWFSEDMTPRRARLESDGRVTVECELSDWS